MLMQLYKTKQKQKNIQHLHRAPTTQQQKTEATSEKQQHIPHSHAHAINHQPPTLKFKSLILTSTRTSTS
jgi:hypothetical protein